VENKQKMIKAKLKKIAKMKAIAEFEINSFEEEIEKRNSNCDEKVEEIKMKTKQEIEKLNVKAEKEIAVSKERSRNTNVRIVYFASHQLH
jgi:hypothetical protein